MTSLEAINKNIYYCRKQVSNLVKIKCINQIEILHINGSIEFYTNELTELKICLNYELSKTKKPKRKLQKIFF